MGATVWTGSGQSSAEPAFRVGAGTPVEWNKARTSEFQQQSMGIKDCKGNPSRPQPTPWLVDALASAR